MPRINDWARAQGLDTRFVVMHSGNVGYAQPPHLFLNDGKGNFHDAVAQAGAG